MSDKQIFTNERVSARNIEEWDYLHEYLMFLRHIFAYQKAVDYTEDDFSILDYGSGTGYGASILSKSVRQYRGVDSSKEAVRNATYEYGSKNVDFVTIPQTGVLPFADNTFDLVISFQVIEHIDDISIYLSEINRVLKAGRVALLTTPNRLLRSYKHQRPINEFHVREYSPAELKNAVEHTFRNIEPMGVFGNEEINRTELERLRKHKCLNTFARQTLATLLKKLPHSKSVLTKLKRRERKADATLKTDKSNWIKYAADDYHLGGQDIDKALDLFYVLTKQE